MTYPEIPIKWKHFPRYWPFVRGIHRSPVTSPHKGQWRGALIFSLICARINGWVNTGEAGDLRRHGAHYDVIVMVILPQSSAHDRRLSNKGFCWLKLPHTIPWFHKQDLTHRAPMVLTQTDPRPASRAGGGSEFFHTKNSVVASSLQFAMSTHILPSRVINQYITNKNNNNKSKYSALINRTPGIFTILFTTPGFPLPGIPKLRQFHLAFAFGTTLALIKRQNIIQQYHFPHIYNYCVVCPLGSLHAALLNWEIYNITMLGPGTCWINASPLMHIHVGISKSKYFTGVNAWHVFMVRLFDTFGKWIIMGDTRGWVSQDKFPMTGGAFRIFLVQRMRTT